MIEQAKNSLTGSKGSRWSPLDSSSSPLKNDMGGSSPMYNNGPGDKKKAQELGKKGMTTAKGLQNYKDSQKKKTSPHDGPRRAKTGASADQVAAFREKQKLSKMNAAERRAYNSPTAKAKRARAARNKG